MSKFTFRIGERVMQMEDLGISMNTQFLKMHESFFHGCGLDIDLFRKEALRFFDTNINNYGLHDSFFQNFTIIWQSFMIQGRYRDGEYIWNMAADIANEWESKHQNGRIHKGTPYYFWGGTCIASGDLERGFLLVHQALEEDRKTLEENKQPPPNLDSRTPAYAFVTLDYEKQDQFFLPIVKEIVEILEHKLIEYRESNRGALELSDLKLNFLENHDLREEVFYCIFNIFRLRNLLGNIDQRLTQNAFSSLLHANVIFAFCLIIDNILKQNNPNQRKWKLRDHYIDLPILSVNFDPDKMDALNNDFKRDFSTTLCNLLNSHYRFQVQPTLTSIEEDLAITYGFRNFGAHRMEVQPVIYNNFTEIATRVLYTLFYSIEKLYAGSQPISGA
ncbi:hypothetical protein IBX73_06875 [candidate division WOR-3 bacterium]|nr:hypothetical protein [candidate division WOR-3 bacterium]